LTLTERNKLITLNGSEVTAEKFAKVARDRMGSNAYGEWDDLYQAEFLGMTLAEVHEVNEQIALIDRAIWDAEDREIMAMCNVDAMKCEDCSLVFFCEHGPQCDIEG
jgi:hypothetical protein